MVDFLVGITRMLGLFMVFAVFVAFPGYLLGKAHGHEVAVAFGSVEITLLWIVGLMTAFKNDE